MKTDDLIAALAADTTPLASPEARLVRSLLPSMAIGIVAVFLLWQARPDLSAALLSVPVTKTVGPLILALAAMWLARGLCYPEARARAEKALLGTMIVAIAVLAIAAFWSGGVSGTILALSTTNTVTCLLSVPVLAALPLASVIYAMRAGAPVDPVRAGADSGLVAGSVSAAIYSLHCPVDSLLFVLPAYGVSILIVVAAGAYAGKRWLRW